VKVVDLGSDFRLDTPERYAEAYGSTHPFPDELGGWRYGLPELFDLEGADRVASPGCYPTAVLLAVAPLVRAGMAAATDIVADCLSGVSGAGRSLREDLLFGEVAEGVRSYAVAVHRHRPEIEMGLDLFCQSRSRVTFTPHLVPIQRGLLATVTCRMTRDLTRSDLLDALRDQYRDRPLVEVIDRPPQTRWVTGSGRALLSAFVDGDRGAIVAQAAIDNLGKGAAAQAVQAANLMVGFAEAEGLSGSGLLP
jgi:N-acetyl-gamma-glutamyl-phosphate reductase